MFNLGAGFECNVFRRLPGQYGDHYDGDSSKAQGESEAKREIRGTG